MIAILVNLFQSELFVQIFSLGLVVLLCALTYLLGFKSNDSPNENQQDKQHQQQPAPRQSANVGNKQKRQSKTQQEIPLPVTTAQQTTPASPKQQSKKAEPKAQKPAKKTTKQEVRKQSTSGLKSDIEVQQTDSNIDGSNGEWITVKDKKQKKTQPADEKPQQLPQKTPNEKSDKVKLQSLPVEHAAPASSTYVEDNNWLTVKEKKSEKKKSQSVSPPVTADSATPVVPTNVSQETPVLTNTDDNNWITVKEKKPKKNSITKLISEPASVPPTQQLTAKTQSPKPIKLVSPAPEATTSEAITTVVTVEAPSLPKKNKSKVSKVVEPAALPVTDEPTSKITSPPKQEELSTKVSTPQEELPTGSKLDLLTSSLSEINSDENKTETEWIQANSKAIKKSAKAKLQPAAPSVKQPIEPMSPQGKKKQPIKQLLPTKPDSLLLPVKSEMAPLPDVVFRNQAASTPDAIAAAIVDSSTSNNQISKTNYNRKSTGNSETNVQTTSSNSNNNKKSKPAVNMSHLKQTNLSDSMILIDSNITSSNLDDANFNQMLTSSAKNSSRTDSNQSSSESIQDLDVDGEDGWATITSKKTKRTTVRREQ